MRVLYEPPVPHECVFPLDWLYDKPLGTIIACGCGKVYVSVIQEGERGDNLATLRRWDEADPDHARNFIAANAPPPAPPAPPRYHPAPPWRRRSRVN